jgi:hypothetical protein
MKEMADAGGGVFYEVEKLTDLAGSYEQVVADLGTMYSLAIVQLITFGTAVGDQFASG